jgi:hypothetical protein
LFSVTLFIMFHILIDTSVWLDLAKDHKQETLLSVIEQLVEKQVLVLIVPQIVVDEFDRNKAHVAEDGLKSLSSAIKRTEDTIHRLGDKRNRTSVYKYLREVNRKIPQMGDLALSSLSAVGNLLLDSSPIPVSDNVKLRAAQRAIDHKAPFHRKKNSMSDAILFETYVEYLQTHNKPGEKFAFVTHNKHDFSSPKDERLPHPDFESIFSRSKSIYSIALGATLKKIEPNLVTQIMMDEEFEFIPRTLTEIYSAEEVFATQVWYNRHQVLVSRVESGDLRIVKDKSEFDRGKTITKEIWRGATKHAREMERKYGKENLGPFTNFDWGMVNGKLSALRWVMGEDWDMLDS